MSTRKRSKLRQVIVTRGDVCWVAHFDGKPEMRGVGDSRCEALGHLVALFAPDFDITVKLIDSATKPE